MRLIRKIKLEWKIKTYNPGFAAFGMILGGIVFLTCGVVFILTAAFYGKMDFAARICLYVFGGVSLFCALALPLGTIWSVSMYPRHKKFAYIFLQPYIFRSDEEIANILKSLQTKK